MPDSWVGDNLQAVCLCTERPGRDRAERGGGGKEGEEGEGRGGEGEGVGDHMWQLLPAPHTCPLPLPTQPRSATDFREPTLNEFNPQNPHT